MAITSRITALTLQQKFRLLLVSAFFTLMVVSFGVRSMALVTQFAYYERTFMKAITQVDSELKRQDVSRSFVTRRMQLAVEQPSKGLTNVFSAELLMYRLTGQGYIMELSDRAIKDVQEVLDFLAKADTRYLSQAEVEEMKLLMRQPRIDSDEFGESLRHLSGFVKGAVNLLVLLCIAVMAGLIVASSRSTLPALNEIVSILSALAKGNLKQKVRLAASGEIGALQDATTTLLQELSQQVRTTKGISGQLKEVDASLETVMVATKQGLMHQIESTEAIVQSVRQLGKQTNALSDDAEGVAAASSAADAEVGSVQQVIAMSSFAITSLADTVLKTAEIIDEVAESSHDVEEIVELIRDIAAQTNLLALNASIEAARAGEYGRGFAVVADEVRLLASRTTDSTDNIEKVIGGIKDASQQAKKIVDSGKEQAQMSTEQIGMTSVAFNAVIEAVQSIKKVNETIVNSVAAQKGTTDSIVQNLEIISAEGAGSSESVKSVTERQQELNQMIKQLETTVQFYQLADTQ